MGRTILADEKIQTYVDKLFNSSAWYLGLIIGKLTNQKDYAVHIVRTPEPLEDQASDDDDSEIPEASKRKRRRSSQCKPSSLEQMNEQWAATHAKQVTTMLPGGLGVIGIFALAPSSMIQNSQAKLRQILFAIHKLEQKNCLPVTSDSITDRVVLQICSTTRKYTCRTIDVADTKSTFRPADWKTSSSSEKWNRVQTDLALDFPVDIPVSSQHTTLSRQIQTGLHPFCERIWSGLTLIDGCVRIANEVLDQSGEKKGKGRGDRGKVEQQIYKCNILVKSSNATEVTDPTVKEYSPKLILKGTMHGRAYITSKATIQDTKNAIKADVIRSLLSRCELLCDDIQMVEEDAEQQELYTTPRRVFFTLPGTSLELCDYMFQDEKPQEVVSRIHELLDIPLTEDDIDLTCEHEATEVDCSQLGQCEVTEDISAADLTQSNKSMWYYMVAGVGGALAFVAAGMTYLLAEQT